MTWYKQSQSQASQPMIQLAYRWLLSSENQKQDEFVFKTEADSLSQIGITTPFELIEAMNLAFQMVKNKTGGRITPSQQMFYEAVIQNAQ